MSKKISAPSVHTSGSTEDHRELTATDYDQGGGNNKRGLDTRVLNSAEIGGAGNTPLITNLAVTPANTEVSHSLQNGLKLLTLRNRSKKQTKVAFAVTESGTNYVTLEAGASWTISPIDFTSKALYVQSPAVSTLEILEVYTT